MSLKAHHDVARAIDGDVAALDTPAARKLAERSPELAAALDKLRAHKTGAKKLRPGGLLALIIKILSLLASLGA